MPCRRDDFFRSGQETVDPCSARHREHHRSKGKHRHQIAGDRPRHRRKYSDQAPSAPGFSSIIAAKLRYYPYPRHPAIVSYASRDICETASYCASVAQGLVGSHAAKNPLRLSVRGALAARGFEVCKPNARRQNSLQSGTTTGDKACSFCERRNRLLGRLSLRRLA